MMPCFVCQTLGVALICDDCRGVFHTNDAPLPVLSEGNDGQIFAAFRYDWPLTRMLHGFKYGRQVSWGGVLCALWCEELEKEAEKLGFERWAAVDIFVPIALNSARFARRGFNQSAELAHGLGRYFGVEVREILSRAEGDDLGQAGLNLSGRVARVEDVFTCTASLTGAHVVLIDDVVTTGVTLKAAAQCLYRAGAARVDAWVLAAAGFSLLEDEQKN